LLCIGNQFSKGYAMYHLLLLAAAASGAFEDLELLDDRILSVAPYAEATDKRLKLAECPDDPVIAPAIGGTVVVRCPALGWRLRVPVKAPAAAPEAGDIIVRKGELVECVSGGPGFAVSVMMIALDDAGAGQAVRVKSLTSPIAVTATAKARGVVSF
jgi:flagellar basal body P-ring formation protein FlgA